MERLDKRVDKMVAGGMLDQLIECFGEFCNGNKDFIERAPETHLTKGVFQAIGAKEFFPAIRFLWNKDGGRLDPESETIRSDAEFQRLFQEGVQQTKLHTRQYVRKQMNWIKRKILPLASTNRRIFHFDATLVDPDSWRQNVCDPALLVVGAFLGGNEEFLASRAAPSSDSVLTPLSRWEKIECETCHVVTNGPAEWKAHLKSRKHRKSTKKRPHPTL